jgi:hypothetical protein
MRFVEDHSLTGAVHRTGLRAGLSAAMARRGFDPVSDRGQVLVDLALMQVLGDEAISDFQGLRHLAPVIGPVALTQTVWRALAEAGQLQLTRLNAAVTSFRRHWWALLAARPQGFGGIRPDSKTNPFRTQPKRLQAVRPRPLMHSAGSAGQRVPE